MEEQPAEEGSGGRRKAEEYGGEGEKWRQRTLGGQGDQS